jgi:hypothetical protein
LDTHSVAVSDVQMFSSSSVNGGAGVYWMFYSGCDYSPVEVPDGVPGCAGGVAEGVCGRPGLAMSQVRASPQNFSIISAIYQHSRNENACRAVRE